MKICLVNPPITQKRFEGYEWSNNSLTIQHLGLGYIAGKLESKGYKVDIIECPGRNISVTELCEMILFQEYDVIGITTYYFNFFNVMRIVSKLKSINRDIFIFLGGYLPSLSYEMVLQKTKGIDCCVLGEGEYVCLELIEAIKNKQNWRDINSICYIKDKQVIVNQMRSPLQNLDELPYPKRVVLNSRFIPISTSRGCYGICNFCGVKEFYEQCNIKSARFRSPENVINEIEQLKQLYNPEVFLISDELFLGASLNRKKWLNKFYELLVSKNLNIRFQALTRANDLIMNEEIIIKLKSVGLINVFIGIESFVQRQLNFFRKLTKVEHNIEAIRILKKHNLKVSLGLMLFDPYVTIDELLENIKYLRETDCCMIVDEKQEFFSIDGPVIAIPGTSLYHELESNNMIINSNIKYELQDEKANLCYEILQKWYRFIKPVSTLFYLLRMAEKHCSPEMIVLLKQAKAKAMLFDLNFFETLCMKIKDRLVTKDNYNLFLEPWIQESKNYLNEWLVIKAKVYNEAYQQ